MTEDEARALEQRITGGRVPPAPAPTSPGPLPDVIRRLVEPARDRDGLVIIGPVPLGVTAFPPGSIVVQDARGMRYIRTPRGELRRQATKPRGAGVKL